VEAVDGPYKGQLTAGSEYETVGLMGTNLLVGDLPTVLKANQLCNRYGLDTISTGNVIGFAMEAWERGLIGAKDTGGAELTWGNGQAVLEMIEQIAFKKGFGAVLEGGVKRAAEKIGGEAKEFALEVKGLEPPAHDPRAKMTVAVGYATSNRGACHLAAFTHDFEEGAPIDDLDLPELKDRFTSEGKAENVVVMQHLMTMFDSLVCCKFGLFGGLTVNPLIEALNAVTGWSFDRKRFFQTGERIFNLKRLYNNRLGIGAKDDVLPKRMRSETKGGGTQDHLPPLEEMMKEYYSLRNWNPDTGKPTPGKIEELELGAYA
jgi:aldehyde:ferredoxin oxidoreductase